jgi:hypothetical protein
MASRKEQIMNQIKTELAVAQAQELINVSYAVLMLLLSRQKTPATDAPNVI